MKRTVLLAGAAAVVLAALALAYFYIPGGVRPALQEGELRVCLNAGGSIELDWPEAQDSSASVLYHLSLKSGDAHLQEDYSAPGLLLEQWTLPLEVQVQPVDEGKNLLGLSRRLTGESLRATVEPADLSAPEALGAPGPGTLALSWTQAGQAPDFYDVFTLKDGQAAYAATAQGKQLDLTVRKQGGDLTLPGYDHPLQVQVRAGLRGEGYVLCGPASNTITVERQDLLGDDLNLAYREENSRMVTLEWDETRGEYYELQEWTGEGWTLLDTLEPAESFAYELGRLGSGSRHRFRVEARDRNGTLRSSEEAEFFASVDPLYATVWPIIEQPFYKDAGKESETLGKLPAGTALCVLEERGDWFQVRYKDQYGWVDSRFCMINLPEYVGDHCSYDIANSYRSVFKVHENPIALITDQVVKGFEHIRTADEQFLVPYLYPCSKKLLSAAQAAEADGYRLKIYEAFRPNEATRFLYDTTAAQLNWAALVYSYEDGEGHSLGPDEFRVLDPVTGWEVDLSDGRLTDPETGDKLTREELAERQAEEETPEEGELPGEGTPGEEAAGAELPPLDPSQPFFTLPEEGEGGSMTPVEEPVEPAAPEAPPPQEETPAPETPAGGEEPAEGEEEEPPAYDTYFSIMTNNGRFNLGSFLARVASAHNRGIALDLTLERADSGEELEMQSAIHDLSWYSAAYLNNDNAKLLEKYMTATGMRGLSSEWWHFQDDETREAIGLSSYLFKGVSLAGWTRDDTGWRCRKEDGSFYRDTAVTVDGSRRAFDRDGYCKE